MCGNPRSSGIENCVSDANRPHVYPAEYAATTAHYANRAENLPVTAPPVA
ncbi:hypothetical protein [Rhodococcoides fascians]|nr:MULTISPECIES: hypothetical protein [Rhodococcus]